VSLDDPFHFISVYNENFTKRVRGITWVVVNRMELGRRWRWAKRLAENEEPMRHQPPTK